MFSSVRHEKMSVIAMAQVIFSILFGNTYGLLCSSISCSVFVYFCELCSFSCCAEYPSSQANMV